MLSEREFSVQWRKLFVESTYNQAACAKADELIDALPETSPLRQRYSKELSDLRKLNTAPVKSAAKPRRRSASSQQPQTQKNGEQGAAR
ncbi:MAG TPA: hypothetical protein VHX65_20610 [Pirellulales bacterium]|jgi:hypothetical protein|nr:hypothetical protein [Pirellulales bacterium]